MGETSHTLISRWYQGFLQLTNQLNRLPHQISSQYNKPDKLKILNGIEELGKELASSTYKEEKKDYKIFLPL